MNVEVNFLAVLFAGVASMVVGFVWYSALFGKSWIKLMGYTKETMDKAKEGMSKTYTISFLLSLLMAYVLSHVMTFSENYYAYPALMTGLTSAFWMWLGFVMPVQAVDSLFSDKKFKLFAINTGYQLASLLAMGITLGLI